MSSLHLFPDLSPKLKYDVKGSSASHPFFPFQMGFMFSNPKKTLFLRAAAHHRVLLDLQTPRENSSWYLHPINCKVKFVTLKPARKKPFLSMRRVTKAK